MGPEGAPGGECGATEPNLIAVGVQQRTTLEIPLNVNVRLF